MEVLKGWLFECYSVEWLVVVFGVSEERKLAYFDEFVLSSCKSLFFELFCVLF